MKCCFSLTKMAIIKKTGSSISETVEKSEPSQVAGGNIKLCSHFGNQFGTFFKKLNTLPYDPAIPLLGIYPEK